MALGKFIISKTKMDRARARARCRGPRVRICFFKKYDSATTYTIEILKYYTLKVVLEYDTILLIIIVIT